MNSAQEKPRAGRPFFGADRRIAHHGPDGLSTGPRKRNATGAASFTRHGPLWWETMP